MGDIELFGDWLAMNSNPFGDSKDIPKGYIMLAIDKIGVEFRLKPKFDFERGYKHSLPKYTETFDEFKKRMIDLHGCEEDGTYVRKDIFDISALVISDYNVLIKNKLQNISKKIKKNQHDMALIYLEKDGSLSELNIFLNRFKPVDEIQSDNLVITKNKTYIQFKWGSPNAVFFRTNGVKKSDLSGDDFLYSKKLSERLGVKFILVNDVKSGTIYLSDYITNSFEKIVDTESWISAYENLGI